MEHIPEDVKLNCIWACFKLMQHWANMLEEYYRLYKGCDLWSEDVGDTHIPALMAAIFNIEKDLPKDDVEKWFTGSE